MGKLQGKVAFVSGGSQGIGEQTALLFGREGASVAVVASSEFAKAEECGQAHSCGRRQSFRACSGCA